MRTAEQSSAFDSDQQSPPPDGFVPFGGDRLIDAARVADLIVNAALSPSSVAGDGSTASNDYDFNFSAPMYPSGLNDPNSLN